MTALPTFATEANALQADVNSKQTNAATSATNAATSATNAATSATNAATSATAAASAANATVWVSGTTYAIGDARFSPIDFRTYRRKTNGAGTTDPSSDTTNWQVLIGGELPYLHVREEQTSGTAGQGLAVGYTTRILNTVVGTNSITGSSLASNQVTLPAGTYRIDAFSTITGGVSQTAFYNVTDSTFAVIGATSYNPSAGICKGVFTISGTKSFSLRVYIGAGGNGGSAASSGQVEVYSSVQIWKVA